MGTAVVMMWCRCGTMVPPSLASVKIPEDVVFYA